MAQRLHLNCLTQKCENMLAQEDFQLTTGRSTTDSHSVVKWAYLAQIHHLLAVQLRCERFMCENFHKILDDPLLQVAEDALVMHRALYNNSQSQRRVHDKRPCAHDHMLRTDSQQQQGAAEREQKHQNTPDNLISNHTHEQSSQQGRSPSQAQRVIAQSLEQHQPSLQLLALQKTGLVARLEPA
ncbi:MAG: hypothetical protein FRX49_02346 [Trebouxia sp. A1-2]|nr:MAG: hypothetical protein FRX49_02346 [Trebouxia sp. A1-2]